MKKEGIVHSKVYAQHFGTVGGLRGHAEGG